MLNILAGEDQHFEGVLKIGQTVKVAYFKQTDERLNRDVRVIDFLREESELARQKMGRPFRLRNCWNAFIPQCDAW